MKPRTWTDPDAGDLDMLRQILEGSYSDVPWREQVNANASRDRPKPPPKKQAKSQPLLRKSN
jgi:hypothetical protein